MKNLLQQDWIRSLMMALVIVGVLLAAFGVQQFVDASVQIEDNPAYQTQQRQETVTLESEAQAQGLMAAGVAYQRLLAQRNRALMIGGVGLAVGALGWLGYDLIRSRQRRQINTDTSY